MLQRTLLATLICTGSGALAQNTIYRCGNAYSDEPCKGGATVDIRPTDGAHSMSGQRRTSIDAVQREIHRGFDKAWQPLTGMSPEEAARRREEQRYKSIPRVKVKP
ncbi:hypothetical protein GCM10010975_28930 [Comamonas phosphati]|nr:hypothetical protein GCM10010975_28930 [Comamonas phosphati]